MNRAAALWPALAASALLMAACGDGGDPEPGPTPTVELTGTAKELLDHLNQGVTATYSATYETTTPEGESGGGYVVYNRPPLTRIDTVPAGGSDTDTVLIGGGSDERTVGCSGGPNAWECSEIEPLGDSLLRAAGPVAYLSGGDIAGYDVTRTANPRTIAGQSLTCYELASVSGDPAGASEYCLTETGVVLYSRTPSQVVEAREFSPTVLDTDFTPPAEPS